MNLRSAIPLILALSLLAALCAAAAPPNILLIAVDDLRPELGCYGAAHMHTPNMDSLAAQGRMFRNHYVAVPTCGASRYALMTGLRPTAATDDNAAFDRMPTTTPATPESWVDLLRRNGWHTASMGKVTHEPDGYRWNYPSTYDIGRSSVTFPDMRFSWDEIVFGHDKWGAQRYPLFAYSDGTGRVRNVSPAFEIGVDENGDSLPDDAYPDGLIAKAAIEKLREFSDDGTRFCLAVGFFKPHLPFNAPKKYYDLYDPATLPGPFPAAKPVGANPSTTVPSGEPGAYTAIGDRAALRRAYFACVSYTDAQVGKVLDELDSLGLADNTVVILWGDHGWCLDDYSLLGKHVVLEHGVEAPLIIRPPADMRPEVFAGVPAEGIVETIDLYPTIAELCGLTTPSGPEGHSLVPLLRNPFSPGKDYAYSRFGASLSLRTPQWRLIQNGGVNDLYDLSSVRYELEDVSAANPTVTSDLAAKLGVPATRPATTYATWSGGDPALSDPTADADTDDASNWFEYSSGTDPLDPLSRPAPALGFEDLSGSGTADDPVFSFTIAESADDVSLSPMTSTDMLAWSFDPLVFLDSTPLGNGVREVRFRLAGPPDARRFFTFSANTTTNPQHRN
jgi:arylsulfatase A-like enzyme